MITLENVSFAYGEKQVLRDCNLSFAHGTVTCIMSPSGKGKTTLLYLLLGLRQPTAGTLSGLPQHPAVVFQEDRLCEDYDAVANIRVAAKVTKQAAKKCLTDLGITDFKSPVSTFSGGMKRRVAIARALCYDGDCLIMDEPFKGLDEELKDGVMDTVKAYTAGKTVIFVTHDGSEAAYMDASVVNL